MVQKPLQTLILFWLAWVLILFGFQIIADQRYDPNRPDRALSWTPDETGRRSQRDKIYLTEPFMNHQVSWDSEFYLSIAVVGYDDPAVLTVNVDGKDLSLNHAFFPFYPILIRVLSVPLSVLGMNPIATATLAGVLISIFGGLFACFALYYLVTDEWGEPDDGIRTAYYLLIFPSAFFLSAVFTEGLFLALCLWCFVFLRRKQFLFAGIVAGFATWTRATGALLILPIGIAWVQAVGWRNLVKPDVWLTREHLTRLLVIALPIGAYLIWRVALGESFELVEDNWFGRSLGNFERTRDRWHEAIQAFLEGDNPQMRVYYGLEFTSVLAVFVAGLFMLRRYPGIALFSVLALLLGMGTSSPQSLIRYVLTTPILMLFLGRLGRNTVFDRAWVMSSILLLGMLVFLFAEDMWVA